MGSAVYTPWPISERSTMTVMELSAADLQPGIQLAARWRAAPRRRPRELDRPPKAGQRQREHQAAADGAVALDRIRDGRDRQPRAHFGAPASSNSAAR